MNSKDKVQAAIVERLQSKTGLDVNALDVNTTSVTFDKNIAYATVAIHPKGDSTVSHGMAMKYTLEAHEGKWTVVKVASPQGMGLAGEGPSHQPLPAGHPSVEDKGADRPAGITDPHRSSSNQPGADGLAR